MLHNTHVMIDLETFGTAPDAPIVSIGAVKFQPHMTGFIDSIEIVIDPESWAHYGFKIDPATMMWWMDPDRDTARNILVRATKLDLGSALEGFFMWYGDKSLPTWGNGPAFDNVIMQETHRTVGMKRPWGHRDDRCYRTLRSLGGAPDMLHAGIAHSAIHDAMAQAAHLQAIVKKLGLQL